MKLFRKSAEARGRECEENREDSLLILCHNNQELYDVMSHFLLLKPEEQIQQMGSTEEFWKRADEARKRGDLTLTRINLEIASRIEIYRGNIEKVRTLMKRAAGLQDSPSPTREKFLLSNLEQCMKIAWQYYHHQSTDSVAELVPILAKVIK